MNRHPLHSNCIMRPAQCCGCQCPQTLNQGNLPDACQAASRQKLFCLGAPTSLTINFWRKSRQWAHAQDCAHNYKRQFDNCFVNGPVHVVVRLVADAEAFREITAEYHQRHDSLAQQGDLRIWTSLFECLSTERHCTCLHMRHDNFQDSSNCGPYHTCMHAHMYTRTHHINQTTWHLFRV